MCLWIYLSNYKLRASEVFVHSKPHTRTRIKTYTRTSFFVPIVTRAMIYRRATMCVEVSTERNERLLTTPRSNTVDFVEARRAFLLGLKGDSSIEVSIGSYNNYLSRIRGGYPLRHGKRAPLSSIRLDSATNKGERGEREDVRRVTKGDRSPTAAPFVVQSFAGRVN